jgi:hypothetical protein
MRFMLRFIGFIVMVTSPFWINLIGIWLEGKGQ